MKDQQIIAIENPCELPEQCNSQRYRAVTRKGKYYVSSLLTVNVGEE